jgi:putative protease
MKKITYLQNTQQLEIIPSDYEIILEHKKLSRFGKLETEELINLFQNAKERGHLVHLEWDVLMEETKFLETTPVFDELKHLAFDSIRVQDPGAIEYVLENTFLKISAILENGNHNLCGLQYWVDYIGDRLDRLVISIELPKAKIEEYIQKLKVNIELLTLGRILLFYTPRNLLSALAPETDEKKKKDIASSDFIEALGESEESPHKGFPLVENRHGTFMFHIKNFYLVDKLKELAAIGLSAARFDLRFDSMDLIKSIELDDFKEIYPHQTIKGYYNVNKTDVLFKKLKNHRIKRNDEGFIGEVVDHIKGQYTAIMVKAQNLTHGQRLKFVTPEGKEIYAPIVEMTDSEGDKISSIDAGRLALINYVGGVWVKSAVYTSLD